MILHRIGYYIFIFFVFLFRITPFWLIYLFSDFLYLIMNYIISYRKSVIIKNLNKCFPEKTKKEKIIIKRKFYKNFTDLLVESIKGFSMSKKELLRRTKSIKSEIADKYFAQGKDVIMLAGHFANWEWGAAATAEYFKHQAAVLYKPLSNPLIDNYIREKRARFGVHLVSIYNTSKYFLKKKESPVAYYMVADQYPTNKKKQKYANFFGSETSFLHGPENYAKVLNIPVIYIEIRREKRGFYEIELFEICENTKMFKENELTQLYANLMEKSIKKQPEDWMWSHKRWKKELYSFK